jgi:DMSO/TMAO reductase YedYZ molybdopterin-dependent catalytic subunit
MRTHRRNGSTTRLACGVLAGVLLFGLAPAGNVRAQVVVHSAASASSGVTLGGLVEHSMQLTAADLRTMPSTTIDVSFKTEHGVTQAAWTGVPLWAVIQRAGLSTAVTSNRLTMLQHIVLATGGDSYTVAFSLGELDPRFGASKAMVVYARDGQPLANDGLRLVVPGDTMGGRAVQTLTSLEIQ